MPRIEIHEKVTQQFNGDRGINRHPSSCFKVMIVREVRGDLIRTFQVAQFDQYDKFHSYIDGPRQRYLNKAQEYAMGLAAITQFEVDLEPTTVPTEIEELEDRIARDTERLDELRGRSRDGQNEVEPGDDQNTVEPGDAGNHPH